ncbi:MAG TPA: CSLREA domain-containing protein [Thermoanaerobaculia bacterium]|nr:CSLREA domain-containing protein [Thermoanaerobaculia bacterium]
MFNHASFRCAVLVVFCSFLSETASAETIIVNSAADSAPANDGSCTLREAIIAANLDTTSGLAAGECAAGSGSDVIEFDISPADVMTMHTIAVSPALGALPALITPIFIDGFSESGASANTLASGNDAQYRIRLSGSGVGTVSGNDPWGLRIEGTGGSEIRGLVITSFDTGGIRVRSADNVIAGNFIGPTQDGMTSAGNGLSGGQGGVRIESNFSTTDVSGNVVGGVSPADRNVISGNNGSAVDVSDIPGDASTADNLTIAGNYIGTRADGLALMPIDIDTAGENGLGINVNVVSNVTIGGTTGTMPGGSCSGACNLIAGTLAAITVAGNGSGAPPDPPPALSTDIQILGNYIGVNVTGTAALGNFSSSFGAASAPGIAVYPHAITTIGGSSPAARNVIAGMSGSFGDGIFVNNASSFDLIAPIAIRGNYIGVNSAGTAAIPNGGYGIDLAFCADVTVGGTAVGEGNVVSGNTRGGIFLRPENTVTQINLVSGNSIGVLADGVTAGGNSSHGIFVFDDSGNLADTYRIGAVAAGGPGGNIIAFNLGSGVAVAGSDATGISILANSIHSNTALGIDLENDDAAEIPDNCDPDTGPNLLQNQPMLTSATSGGGSTNIVGTLNGTASSTFTIEFFSNETGSDEGRTSIGSAAVATDGSCAAAIDVTLGVTVPAGNTITATATDANMNTSEFSNAVTIPEPPLQVAKSFNPATIPAGETSTLTITLTTAATQANDVAFTDFYPSNLVNTTPLNVGGTCGGVVTAAAGGNNVSLTGGTIPAGSSCTVIVDVTSAATGVYTNTIPAGDVSSSTHLSNDSPATADLTVMAPPSAAKTFDSNVIQAGQTSALRITLTNPNAAAITGAAFTDSYPGGIVNATPLTMTNTCSGTVIANAGGTFVQLANGVIGAASSCFVEILVTSSTPGDHVNTLPAGAVTSSNAGATVAPATDTLSVFGPLAVEKAFATDPIRVGEFTVLTITLTNPNQSVVTGVAFSDVYPAGIINATPSGASTNCAGGSLIAADGGGFVELTSATVPASGNCTVTVTVTGTTAGTHTNTIAAGGVTSANAPANTAAASDTLTVVAPPAVTKSFVPSSIAAGGTSQLTIALTNPNALAATGAGFVDQYPAGLVNAAASNVTTTCGGAVTANAGTDTATLSGATIPGNGSCTVTVDVTSAFAGDYTNVIAAGDVVSSVGPNTAPAQATLQVAATSAITAMKTFNPPAIPPAGTSVLTVTLTNTNPLPVIGVAFTDTYAAGLANRAVPNAASTCGGVVSAAPNGTSLSLTGGTIPANGSCSVSVDVTLTGVASVANTIPAGAITAVNAPANEAAVTAVLAASAAAAIPALSLQALLALIAVLGVAGFIATRR